MTNQVISDADTKKASDRNIEFKNEIIVCFIDALRDNNIMLLSLALMYFNDEDKGTLEICLFRFCKSLFIYTFQVALYVDE